MLGFERFFVPLQANMKQDIIDEIIEPLDGYLSGYLTEKEVDWSELRWCAKSYYVCSR